MDDVSGQAMRRLRLLGFLVGIALFIWILKNSDLAAVWRQVRAFHWRFGVVFLFYAVIFGLDTLGWRFALNLKNRSQVSWRDLFRTRLAGEAVNYLTPTATIGGEPVKAALLNKRHGIPLAEGMASVVVAKTTLAASMLLFVLVGLILAVATQPLNPELMRWVWVTGPVLVGLMALFLFVQFAQPFHRGAGFLERFFPRWFEKVTSQAKGWDEAVTGIYRDSPLAVIGSLTFHFLGWVAGVMEVYLILRFLQIPVSLGTAWSIEAVWVLLRSGAFLIPASLGASEGFILLICAGLGINAVSGLALGLIRRAREFLWMGWGLVEFARE